MAKLRKVRLNFSLQVGAQAQAVEVTVSADTLIATTSASVGSVLTDQKVKDLPISARNVLDLLSTMPGAGYNAIAGAFAGGRVTAVNVTRDGINVQDGRYQEAVQLGRLKTGEGEALSVLGIPAVMLFGLPAHKDEWGSEDYAADGIVQQATRALKQAVPDLIVVTDVCMCEYTEHGHCGILENGEVNNDATLELLSRVSVSHARAGAIVRARIGAAGEVHDLVCFDPRGARIHGIRPNAGEIVDLQRGNCAVLFDADFCLYAVIPRVDVRDKALDAVCNELDRPVEQLG